MPPGTRRRNCSATSRTLIGLRPLSGPPVLVGSCAPPLRFGARSFLYRPPVQVGQPGPTALPRVAPGLTGPGRHQAGPQTVVVEGPAQGGGEGPVRAGRPEQ